MDGNLSLTVHLKLSEQAAVNNIHIKVTSVEILETWLYDNPAGEDIYDEHDQAFFGGPLSALISIGTAPTKYPGRELQVPQVRLSMTDSPDPSPLGPQMSHVQQALDLAESLEDGDSLVIHCRAGISRSTAVALAILAKTRTPAQALADLLDIRNTVHPNPLIVAYASHLAYGDGSLSAEVGSYFMRFHRHWGLWRPEEYVHIYDALFRRTTDATAETCEGSFQDKETP